MATGSRSKNRMARGEQARKTRRAVVEAATRLFQEDGFLSTTMAAIAAEAGVAVQTLYLSFANKTAILSAAFDQAIAGDDEPTPLLEREWMREVIAIPDGPAALATFVEISTQIVGRATPLYMVIRSAAADPEVAEVLAKNKQERYRQFAILVDALATKSGFTTRSDTDECTGVVYAVLSEDTYALLVQEHDWTSEQWKRWTLRTLLAELFSDRSGSDARTRHDRAAGTPQMRPPTVGESTTPITAIKRKPAGSASSTSP